MDELLLRVKNIINSRKLIRKQVHLKLNEIKQKHSHTLSRLERKMRTIIIDNISDSRFNVSKLAQELGIDRTALFRKTKKELNIGPSKYIQKIRLNIAKELLEKESISISEAAYATGFESLSYFSKTFKDSFGQAPSTWNN
jgi:AraC-like DNA-binding protein